MNIFKREMKAGLKPFLFWTLGLFVLVFAGVVKSTGLTAGGAGFTALTDSLPRIVKAVFSFVGVDISSFGGYYAVLAQYVLVLAAVYAVHLGNNAVSRETVDKTYEFVFTKPRSRSFILARKLLAGLVWFTVFCLLDFAFSAAAVEKLNIGIRFTSEMVRFALAAWLTGIVFFALGALFAAAFRSAERGAKAGNLAVLAAYGLGVVYDMLENGGILRFLSPFRYFLPAEMLESGLNPLFIVLCALVSCVCVVWAFLRFEKRDLGAV